MRKKALKLFVIRHRKGGATVDGEDGNPIYYYDKQIAKQNRKEGQVVSYGIDHHKYNHNRKGGL